MTFDIATATGNVIANIAHIPKSDLSRAIHYMKPVFHAGLSMGDRVAIRMPGHQIGRYEVPRGKIIISTICSVTINGIFQDAGIPVVSRFGGLIEMSGGTPKRFLELTEYQGTSTDPHKMFIMSNLTDVNGFAATGNGIVGVSFREVPSAALERVKILVTQLRKVNLNGVLAIGHPNRPLMDIRVGEGRTGMITIDGLNPIAALHEAGIPIKLRPLSGLEEITEYLPFSEVAPMERRSTYVE
jgi:repressor of nif and glnA expression